MSAAPLNFEIGRGDNAPILSWQMPFDTAGSVFELVVKSVSASSVVTLTLRSDEDEIDVDTDTDIVSWAISTEQSAALPVGQLSRYTLRRIVPDDGEVRYYAHGWITVVEGPVSTTEPAVVVAEGPQGPQGAQGPQGVPGGDIASVVGRYIWEDGTESGTLVGAMGDDSRQYRMTVKNGLVADHDANVTNPLGVNGYPEYLQDLAGDPTDSPFALRSDWERTLFLFPVTGASLAGCANDNPADAAIDTVSPYPDKVFMAGIPVGRDPAMFDFDRLLPLVDVDTTSVKGTTLPKMCWTIADLCQSHFGIVPNIASYIASQGGSTTSEIKAGTVTYQALVKGAINFVAAARREGWRVVIPVVVVNYGQDNRAAGITLEWDKASRINFVDSMRADLLAITQQKEPIQFLMIPPNNTENIDGEIPEWIQAPLDLHGVNGIVCAPPNFPYQMSWVSSPTTGVHLNSQGYHDQGEMTGYNIFDIWLGTGFTPLRAFRSQWHSATELDVYYTLKSGHLTLDTSGTVITLPEWGGLIGGIKSGVQFFGGDGVERAITNMVLVADPSIAGSPKRIIRYTITSPTSGYLLAGGRNTYGLTSELGPNAGPITGARHLIRNDTPLASGQFTWANIQNLFVGAP